MCNSGDTVPVCAGSFTKTFLSVNRAELCGIRSISWGVIGCG